MSSDESEKLSNEPEKLAEFHEKRMLDRDIRNEYKLVGLIDYDD